MRDRLLALLICMLFPVPGSADEGLRTAPIFAAAIFRDEVIPVRTTTLRGLQQASESRTRMPPGALLFRRTYRVEKDARDRLLASLLATTEDPGGRSRIRESVASDDIWREFDRLLGFAGYSGRNLADVTTGFYVIVWQVVSDGHAIDHLSGVRIVRDAIAQALLADPDIAAMPDADKQRAAVVMAYMAIAAAAHARDLRRAGDTAGLARLRDEVRRSVERGQGVDLAALQLTNLGFVAN